MRDIRNLKFRLSILSFIHSLIHSYLSRFILSYLFIHRLQLLAIHIKDQWKTKSQLGKLKTTMFQECQDFCKQSMVHSSKCSHKKSTVYEWPDWGKCLVLPLKDYCKIWWKMLITFWNYLCYFLRNYLKTPVPFFFFFEVARIPLTWEPFEEIVKEIERVLIL